MHIQQWLRPPRHLLVIFLGTTFVFLAAIGWLGWRSLETDDAVEAQRVREQVENSTDLVAAEIRQRLADIETELARLTLLSGAGLEEAARSYSLGLGDDALAVVFERDGVLGFPAQRLLYRPAVAVREGPDARVFAIGEAYEDRGQDYERAALYFEDLADVEDPEIRAGALLRLARNQRKAGRVEAALATYRRLQGIEHVAIEGRPVELLARSAGTRLLEELGRDAALVAEARALAGDLHGGRWPLTRATYQYYAAEVQQWLGESAAQYGPGPEAEALAAAVDLLWERWGNDEPAQDMMAGRTSVSLNGRSVLLVWRGADGRLVALIGGPAFLMDHVIGPVRTVLDRQQVGVVLADGEGRSVVSYAVPALPAQTPVSELRAVAPVTRTMAETRLPWTLRVVSAGQSNAGQLEARRLVLLAGLGFLTMLVLAGGYFSARAITREIEAARLQSEFVAAVSHEFRTPLTLLRQFSDLLVDGRVSSESERRKYYAALQRGTRRLTRLVEDLLDFGRMEAGSRGFRLVPVYAKESIVGVATEFQEEVRNLGYQMEVDWDAPDGLVVQADEPALARALWNLLDNAVKYSPVCKTVWLTGRFNGQSLIVSVRDQGVGVPANERRAIFRKFVRGSTPDGDVVVKGTGLGLTMVAQIVEGHGGTVELESAVGQGSTFSISLPAHAEPARAMVS